MLLRLIRSLVLMLALAAAPAIAADPPLTVLAAASLNEALTGIGADYTRATGQPVRFSFAASGIIARQLAAGAKADLFVSADNEAMDAVEKAGLLKAGTRGVLLAGRLVLIAPRDSKVTLTIAPGFPLAAALGEGGRLATGDPDYVPAGRYARAALTSLGVWPQVEGRLARAENVRAALAYVARGDAPLGIVYETDARIEPRVKIAGVFPASSHPPIVYPAAVLANAGPGAERFMAYLRGPARVTFSRLGFVTR